MLNSYIVKFTIKQADASDLGKLVPLFEAYRAFYQQAADTINAENFLFKLLSNQESVVFIAEEMQSKNLAGFTQLYPLYSSVMMAKVWLLNDLYVEKEYRGKNLSKELMKAAELYGKETEAIRIILATQTENFAARQLYKSIGYTKDEEFEHYYLNL